MKPTRIAILATVGLLLTALPVPAGETDPPAPLEIDQTEHVEVQLILVDVLVLDRAGRTVPDLTIDDFKIKLDGLKQTADTFDVDCPIGVTREPKNGEPAPPGSRARPLQTVLLFDYFHMTDFAETLRSARDAVSRSSGNRHMIVSLGETLRIESPMGAGREATLAALDRMEHDRGLFAANYTRYTDAKFFEKFLLFFDLMELQPDRKVVVMFSGPFLADGWNWDWYYRQLASMAARTRTAVYPVDSAGLRTGSNPPTLAKLARVATETGGRYTQNTNDLALAHTRAARDAACTYTIGFYDEQPRADRNRRVQITVRGINGLRAIHPSSYIVRSRKRQLRSMAETATMVPELFESGGLSASPVVTTPAGAYRWNVDLAIELPRPLPEVDPSSGSWRLGGVVRSAAATLQHRFRRKLDAAVVESETVRLRPGRYTLALYLYHDELERPLATLSEFTVPKIPRELRRSRKQAEQGGHDDPVRDAVRDHGGQQ